jgi:hypothetical protein
MQTTVCTDTQAHAATLKTLAERLNHHAKAISEAGEILAGGKDFGVCHWAVLSAIEMATADLAAAYGDAGEFALMVDKLAARA